MPKIVEREHDYAGHIVYSLNCFHRPLLCRRQGTKCSSQHPASPRRSRVGTGIPG